MKLEYYSDHQWEEEFIEDAKQMVNTSLQYAYTQNNLTSFSSEVIQTYRDSYAPTCQEAIEPSDSDDEFLNYISRRPECEAVDEIREYLRAAKAHRKTNILQWWKVNIFFSLCHLCLRILLIFTELQEPCG